MQVKCVPMYAFASVILWWKIRPFLHSSTGWVIINVFLQAIQSTRNSFVCRLPYKPVKQQCAIDASKFSGKKCKQTAVALLSRWLNANCVQFLWKWILTKKCDAKITKPPTLRVAHWVQAYLSVYILITKAREHFVKFSLGCCASDADGLFVVSTMNVTLFSDNFCLRFSRFFFMCGGGGGGRACVRFISSIFIHR